MSPSAALAEVLAPATERIRARRKSNVIAERLRTVDAVREIEVVAGQASLTKLKHSLLLLSTVLPVLGYISEWNLVLSQIR